MTQLQTLITEAALPIRPDWQQPLFSAATVSRLAASYAGGSVTV